jgi:GT2 family glycosyltransferase/glycosyltransferase involved in cell wall biosynthesis
MASSDGSREIREQRAELLEADVVIDLPVSTKPLVSVIIPIYGQVEFTLRCLASIGKTPPKMPFEVIVIDDCSPDNSVEMLGEVRGIRLIRNFENQGFIRSCNLGAEAALGEYLCFLNNDTEVSVDWLDELLRTFAEFPSAGLVGSKLIYPDGRLQEAGAIIWRDGSAWNFGRYQNPEIPVFNYAREVDYCSGASIMCPQSLFNELGGFDEAYLPAYCEDADLCLKIRERGYSVIYQPMSRVIHWEGATSGTDTSTGTKAYQVANTVKLHQRWEHQLQNYQENGMEIDRAKDRGVKNRVLFLDHCTPTPDQDSGSIDAFNQMLILRQMGFQVTFIPEDNFLFMQKYTSDLQRNGIEVLYAPYLHSVEEHVKKFGARYDLVLVSRFTVAERHISALRKNCLNAKIWLHTVDLHSLRAAREYDLLGKLDKATEAEHLKARELSMIQESDLSTVVSVAEYDYLLKEKINAKVKVLPYARDVSGTNVGFLGRKGILFVGGFQHGPNVDAVVFFISNVMPILRKHRAVHTFYIAGSNIPKVILDLSGEDVVILGHVPELKPILDQMLVSVAPLRYGAGIKGKIGTSLSAGLPTVATSIAAEGMSLVSGEHVLVADSPDDIAKAIIEICTNRDLWNKLSVNGIEFAQKQWGARRAWDNMKEVLAELGFAIGPSDMQPKLYRERQP